VSEYVLYRCPGIDAQQPALVPVPEEAPVIVPDVQEISVQEAQAAEAQEPVQEVLEPPPSEGAASETSG
jgi:hypothetical protein